MMCELPAGERLLEARWRLPVLDVLQGPVDVDHPGDLVV